MQELKSMQDKFNISDQDLYILSKLSSDLKSSSILEKENINAKIRSVLGKYKIGLVDNMNIVKLLKKSSVHLETEFVEKYEGSENSDELKVVGKSGQKKFIFIAGIMIVFFLAFSLSKGKDTANDTNTEMKKVTFEEATQFMKNRLSDVDQTLMASKMVLFDGKKIYMFMSVAKDGSTCISAVSEFQLSVLNTDCGNTDVKIQEWNNL